MMLALRSRSAMLRSAVLGSAAALAASAALPAFAQAPPGADPFAGGAYAVPIGSPVAVAYGDPAASPGATLSGPVISGPMPEGTVISGPTPSGGPVYMAPQVIGAPPVMGGAMPGSPGCNCGPGGAPVIDPSMGGTMMGPSFGAPMMGPTYDVGIPIGGPMPIGGMPTYAGPGYDDGCCLNDCCLASVFGCCSATCDPCQPAYPPVCDPCQPAYPACPPVCDPCQPSVVGAPQGGIYHGAGGAQRCGWATGFSWVFLRPYYGANDALFVTAGSGGSTTTTGRDFDYSLDLSPRVFVEYVGRDDTGFRATWFGFENDADAVTAGVPDGAVVSTALGQTAIEGETVSANSGFDIDVIDLDLTQRLQVRRSLVNIGGGVRWAGFDHDYSAVVSGPLGTSTGDADRRFDGIGPTVFAEWRRPLGSSRFSLLANIRGSMLYGESDTETTVVTPVFSETTRTENDDFVAIGETQLGGEWSTWISPRAVLFVQAAWETQYWLGVGTALDRNDDVGLFGFNTTVGLEW